MSIDANDLILFARVVEAGSFSSTTALPWPARCRVDGSLQIVLPSRDSAEGMNLLALDGSTAYWRYSTYQVIAYLLGMCARFDAFGQAAVWGASPRRWA